MLTMTRKEEISYTPAPVYGVSVKMRAERAATILDRAFSGRNSDDLPIGFKAISQKAENKLVACVVHDVCDRTSGGEPKTWCVKVYVLTGSGGSIIHSLPTWDAVCMAADAIASLSNVPK